MRTESMDVSVIFATHNREDVLESVLDAWEITNCTTKYSYEIICSDDASTDSTVQILKRRSSLPLKIIENEKGGAGKARNAALKVASGKVVIFTGDDIFPCPEFVNLHYENHLKFGKFIATLGRIEWHKDININYLMHHITQVGCEQFGFIGLPPYQLIDFRHFYTSNISVSRKLLDELEILFDGTFDKYGFEDIELGYRLQNLGMKVYYDPDIVTEHHHIYKSVEGFCNRQYSAGEELVIFYKLHPDLEDKCIIDVDNYRNALGVFLSTNRISSVVKSYIIKSGVYIAKQITKILEHVWERKKSIILEQICSVLFAGIFKYSFFLGCASKIAQEENWSNTALSYFTYIYMKKSYHQIYFDTGIWFNEEESRKWVCWNNHEIFLKKILPQDVKAIRITPLKRKCIAQIKEIYFVDSEGKSQNAEIVWHNACTINGEYYDFTQTDDPQIVIESIPEGSKKLCVRMAVTDMKKSPFMASVMKAVKKLYRRKKITLLNTKKVDIKYACGQSKRLQICIDWNNDKIKTVDLVQAYAKAVTFLGTSVRITESANLLPGYTNYLYAPRVTPLTEIQFTEVIYTLMNSNYDYVIVSRGLEDFPYIVGECMQDSILFMQLLGNGINEINFNAALGRFLRLPVEESFGSIYNIQEFIPNIRIDNEFFLGNHSAMQYRLSPRNFEFKKKKPLIFVFPIFMAVGGVERNTIEVMRALKEEYDFCVITMERHSKMQGTLHYQLKEITEYIFDLREITEFKNYISSLYELNTIFSPDLIWLCNNSPWFEEHASQVRNVFCNIPIVAQDVYDTKVGWIEYYNTPGMKSFDRFIAVTELIKDTFQKSYQINPELIDVIYSVVDDAHIIAERAALAEISPVLEKYGLDPLKERYAYIGRLMPQKNPLRYLQLAKLVLEQHEKEIQFVMVGSGALEAEVLDYIANNQLKDKIIYIPYVHNTPELIKALNGLVLTSDYEGMPIVSIEAMSLGIPVFSTDTGDTKRFINQTKGGLILDEKYSDYENFMFFRKNIEEYRKNAIVASENILNFFSVSNQTANYRSCFNQARKKYSNKE